MNEEELTTLSTLQGTSHCSCLEHCFSFHKQDSKLPPVSAAKFKEELTSSESVDRFKLQALTIKITYCIKCCRLFDLPEGKVPKFLNKMQMWPLWPQQTTSPCWFYYDVADWATQPEVQIQDGVG